MAVLDAFLELMLPVIEVTVTAAEEAGAGQGQDEHSSSVQPQVLKALRRRERLARHKKKSQSADESTLFKVLILGTQSDPMPAVRLCHVACYACYQQYPGATRPDTCSHFTCVQPHVMHAVVT